MITGFLAESTSTLQAIVFPFTSPVPLAIVRHAVVRVLRRLADRLDVLDRLADFLVELFYCSVERILIRDPEDDLQPAIRRRDGHIVAIRRRLPAVRHFKPNAALFMGEDVGIPGRVRRLSLIGLVRLSVGWLLFLVCGVS